MAKAWLADGKGFAIRQQMANSLSETLPVKASLPSAGWWQRACAFAISWQMAKPLNGVSPVRRLTAYFAVCQQMAKAAGSLPSASRWQRLQALCRLPADGKVCRLFVVCQQMAKAACFAVCQQMAKSPNRPAQILHVDDTWPLCHLPADGKALCHLPADGKVPILPHLILFFSYINSFSQKIKHKYIYMTNIAYSIHITNSHEHIYPAHKFHTFIHKQVQSIHT